MICFTVVDQEEVLMTIEKTISLTDTPYFGTGTLGSRIGVGDVTLVIENYYDSGSPITVSIPNDTLENIATAINNEINSNSSTIGYTSAVINNGGDYTFTLTVIDCAYVIPSITLMGFQLFYAAPTAFYGYFSTPEVNTSLCTTYTQDCNNLKANLQIYNCCLAKKSNNYIELKKKGKSCEKELRDMNLLAGYIDSLLPLINVELDDTDNCITREQIEQILNAAAKICNDCGCDAYVDRTQI
jgi:hypothetical protein